MVAAGRCDELGRGGNTGAGYYRNLDTGGFAALPVGHLFLHISEYLFTGTVADAVEIR